MRFDLLLGGGTVVVGGALQRLDVAVREGRIAAVTTERVDAGETLDCRGLTILPGCIDTHVHFREPGRTDKEDFGTGTTAAAAGGITTVLEIQNNEPLTMDAAAAEQKLALVTHKARVNFAIYGNVGVQNLETLQELAPYVVAFKVFMTQSVGPLTVTDIGDLAKAFRAVAKTGRVLAVHAESDGIHRCMGTHLPNEAASHVKARPPVSEWIAVAEAIELARAFGTRLHLPHLSTARAVEHVRRAKEDGLDISAATCPQYLYFDAADVAREGNWLKINPAIKHDEDREALIEGVRSGVLDHVHSDHAPHTADEKRKSYRDAPSGLPGIQHEVPVLLDLHARGRLSLPDVARLLGEGPARAFDLAERGAVTPGYHADLTIVDPSGTTASAREDILSRAGHSPFIGRKLVGAVVATVVGGRIIYRDGRMTAGDFRGVRIAP